MRSRRAHLEVDEREGEGLERVVVAEEGAQPRPESERRQARATGHPEPPGRRWRSAVGSGARSRRGGERGGIRGLFRRRFAEGEQRRRISCPPAGGFRGRLYFVLNRVPGEHGRRCRGDWAGTVSILLKKKNYVLLLLHLENCCKTPKTTCYYN
jgi:hypothetical protein